jgi:hypothetical protein
MNSPAVRREVFPRSSAPWNHRAPPMTIDARRGFTAALLLAAPLLLIALPMLLGQTLFAGDLLTYTYPLKLYVRQRLLDGSLPLWNPQLGLGRPVLGMIQPGALDPLNALTLLPLPLGVDLFSLVHLPIAALGLRHWLRAIDVEDPVATAGGVFFAFSGPYLSLLTCNGTYAWGFAFVPWFLSCLTRVLATDDRAARARLAVFGALVLAWSLFAGDPMSVYFAGLAGAAVALARARPRWPAALATLAVIGALAALLGAVQLLPAAEVNGYVRGAGIASVEADHFALHPLRLLELVWPGLFGAPHTPEWFVHALYDEGTGQPYEPLMPGLYFGLALPFLALAALARPQRRPVDVAVAVLTAFALCVALGRRTPLWSPFFHFFPGARLFRHSEKYAVLASLGLCFLGARGVAVAVEHPVRSLRVALAALVPLALAALAGQRFGAPIALALVGRLGHVTPAAAGAVIAGATLRSALVAVAYALVFALAAKRAWSVPQRRLVLVALLIADVTLADVAMVRWARGDVHDLRAGLAADLRRADAGHAAPTRIYRSALLQLDHPGVERAVSQALTLKPNLGLGAGVAQLDPYDAFAMPREARFTAVFRARPTRLLQVTATRFALLLDEQLPPGHGLRVIARYPGWGASLVEVPGVVPRAYVPARVLASTSQAESESLLRRPEFVPARDAVIEGATAGENRGACVVEAEQPERVALRCEAAAPGWAVLTDVLFPGWTATVDGRAAEIHPANLALRAVRIPAGRSRVEMRYRPRRLVLGAWTSLAAILASLAVVAASLRRSRQSAGSAG